MYLADHEIANDQHRYRIHPANGMRIKANRCKEQRRGSHQAAACRNGQAHEIAVHHTGVHIEASQSPGTTKRKKDCCNPAEIAIILQAEAVGQQCRSRAKGYEIAERIHFLAELTAHAKKSGSPAIQAVCHQRCQNKNRSHEQIPVKRRNNRTHAKYKVRRCQHIRD